MTDIPGTKFGHLTLLRTDGTGKCAVCFCICQRSVVASLEALRSGTITSCGCQPLPRQSRDAIYAEEEQQQRRRDRGGWRPGQ